jgi:hypothetical protein
MNVVEFITIALLSLALLTVVLDLIALTYEAEPRESE